jgi:methylenetetrahydrofolate dehydrogenase (NADP+)/methenyltetrahydrofolate cyclohydrolase
LNNQNKIIDGKYHAEVMLGKLAEEVAILKAAHGITPKLVVVLVGDDPASTVYVRNKVRNAVAIGMLSEVLHFPPSIDQGDLQSAIDSLNQDSSVHGIIAQMPLPDHLSPLNTIAHIDRHKDVDGFHPINVGLLHSGNDPEFAPCTPLGCIHLLKEYGVSLSGKHAVVIGRSQIVGRPVAALLLRENCTVTICHSKTQNLANITKQADIVVSAMGKPRSLGADHFKEGATVLDVGITRMEHGGKAFLVGDVDFEGAIDKVGLITPVPGGVGPMTVAYLLENTIRAAKRRIL